MNTTEQLTTALAGRYDIDREIGAGGMATVYLARDLKHNRRVALKVLKPELGAVLGVERFLAEIQVTANLQHPNLLPLFDSGEANGLLFYVMPFVEGETLRARLDREKQLPIDEAIRLTVAIAGALEYAHAAGVIHRDLKPENILLQAGQPVIADFGIALAVSKAGGARVTQTGLSLGTPQYMSPEQATGDRAIDGRSDIYSLAAMLYEMLTGDAPHVASTAQAVVAKVLTERPSSVRVMRAAVPEHVAFAIGRALEKLPADRWNTAREFADALQGRGVGLLTSDAAPTRGNVQGAMTWRQRFRDPVLLSVTMVAVIALGTAIAMARAAANSRAAAPTSAIRVAVTTPANERPVLTYTWPAAVSPDGKVVVYAGESSGGGWQLYARRLDQLDSRPIAGTEQAAQPLFSPDGTWLAFVASGKLKKVQLDGGTPTSLTDASSLNGGDWSVRDVIVLGAEGKRQGLSRVSAAGGDLVEFTTPDTAHGIAHIWPVVLDDGKTVLFAASRGISRAESRIGITTIDGGKTDVLDLHGMRPLGVLDSKLVYVQADGAVMAVPFDVARRRVTGSPVPGLDSISVCAKCNGDSGIHLSRSGSLVYLRGAVGNRMVWVDMTGAAHPVSDELRVFGNPRLSPDGKTIAIEVSGAQTSDVWTYDIRAATFGKLTSDSVADLPAWTPDSKRVVFRSQHGGTASVRWQLADRSGPAETLADSDYGEAAVSPDGAALVYPMRSGRQVHLAVTRGPGDHAPRADLTGGPKEIMPQFSPDGRWVAYVTDDGGAQDVYVRSFPNPGARTQVSDRGGTEPVWSPDGRRLYYRVDGAVVAAAVTTTPTFAVLSRQSLFNGRFAEGGDLGAAYDISRDGTRFLMLKPNDENLQLVVVNNWVSELHARTAPVSKR